MTTETHTRNTCTGAQKARQNNANTHTEREQRIHTQNTHTHKEAKHTCIRIYEMHNYYAFLKYEAS